MPPQERHVRYRCELYARVQTEAVDVKARVLELSESGAFIEETAGFDEQQVEDEGVMTLALPGGEPWSGSFRVMRLGSSRREVRDPRAQHVTVAASGYGVEFLQIDDDELERLRDFLELLELR